MSYEKEHLFVVVSRYPDFPGVTVAKGFELALLTFLQEARCHADLFPEEKVDFVGQDVDLGLPILAMSVGGEFLVSLQSPPISDGGVVIDGELVDMSAQKLKGIDPDMTPQDIAHRLRTSFFSLNENDRIARHASVMKSMAAHRWSESFGEILINQSKDCALAADDEPFCTEELLSSIDGITLMMSV